MFCFRGKENVFVKAVILFFSLYKLNWEGGGGGSVERVGELRWEWGKSGKGMGELFYFEYIKSWVFFLNILKF